MQIYQFNANLVGIALGRTLTATEVGRVELYAAEALTIIRKRLGDPDLLDTDALNTVIRRAIQPLIIRKDADGAVETQVTIDDGTIRRRYSEHDSSQSLAGITIDDDGWALLTPADRASRAFTIRPSHAPQQTHRRGCR